MIFRERICTFWNFPVELDISCAGEELVKNHLFLNKQHIGRSKSRSCLLEVSYM